MNWRRIVTGTTAGLLLVLLLFLLFRNYLLHAIINKISKKLEKEYNMELVVGDASFSSLATVEMVHLSITPYDGDTLCRLDTLSATPSLSALLFFHLRIKTLEMKSGYVHLSCLER